MKKVTEYLQYLFDFFWHNFKKKIIHYQLYLILSIIHFISNIHHVSLLNSELHQLRSFPRSGRPGAAGRRLTRCLLQLSISVTECRRPPVNVAAVIRECSHDPGLAGVRW